MFMGETSGGLVVLNSKWRGEEVAGVVITGRGGGILKAVSMKAGRKSLKAGLADLTGSSSHQTCLADVTAGQHLPLSPSSDQGNGIFPGQGAQWRDQAIGKTG